MNPYDTINGSILKTEDINYDPDTGQQREVVAFSIASKRYAIATRQRDGAYRIATDSDGKPARSEHGLGHLQAPARQWENQLWEWIISTDTGHAWTDPEWFDQPALGRLTVNTAYDWKLLRHVNQGRDYHHQIRPSGFLIIAHPHHVEEAGLLVAPFAKDPAEALVSEEWFDRSNRKRTGLSIRTSHPHSRIEGSVAVLDYRHYVEQYRQHQEATASGLDGEPCRPSTFGRLQQRRLEGAPIVALGKEASFLEGTAEPSQVSTKVYGASVCDHCQVPLRGRQMRWCSESCRKRHQR